MASRPDKEALGINVLGEFAKAFAAARQQKKAQAQEDLKFERELAMKRIQDEQAAAWKRAQFQLDQQKALMDVASRGSTTTFTDPVTGKVFTQGAKMNPADVLGVQQSVQGIQYPGATLPGLARAETQPTDPLLQTPFFPRPGEGQKAGKTGAGGGAGSESPYEKKFAEKAATEDADVIASRPAVLSDVALLGDTAKKIGEGTFKVGPGQSILTRWRQPEFATALGRVKNIAIAEFGKSYKGAMSDREFATMIEGALNPEIADKASLSQNLADLATVRNLSLKSAEARAAWVNAGNSPLSFKPDPELQAAFDRIVSRSKDGAIRPDGKMNANPARLELEESLKRKLGL